MCQFQTTSLACRASACSGGDAERRPFRLSNRRIFSCPPRPDTPPHPLVYPSSLAQAPWSGLETGRANRMLARFAKDNDGTTDEGTAGTAGRSWKTGEARRGNLRRGGIGVHLPRVERLHRLRRQCHSRRPLNWEPEMHNKCLLL